MATTLHPTDVFVPGKFPIEEANAYADRGTPQRDTHNALKKGYVPLVFGGYGVGKSSMVARVAQDFKEGSTVVYIETVYGKSLDAIFRQILEKIGYEVTVQRTKNAKKGTTATLGTEVEGGIFQVIKAKLKGSIAKNREEGQTDVIELVVTSPTESRIIDICEENRILLIIEADPENRASG